MSVNIDLKMGYCILLTGHVFFFVNSTLLFSFFFFADYSWLIISDFEKKSSNPFLSSNVPKRFFFLWKEKNSTERERGPLRDLMWEIVEGQQNEKIQTHTHAHSRWINSCLSKLTQIMGAFRRSSSKFRDLTSICPVHKSAFMFFCVHFCFSFG